RKLHQHNVRIIGGNPADIAEFPFAAAIYTTTNDGRYFCGGAIIHRQWILTAAHCVIGAVSFSIQVGSNSLKKEDNNRLTISATASIPHPDFDKETFTNNIGLINLPETLRFNDYINGIALPSAAVPDNTITTAIGWGQTDDEISGPVDDLNKVILVTLANEHCKYTYGDQITENMVCADGLYNEGTCIGDIGGPLIQYQNGEAVHIATASFLSFNGCESIDPSGFTRTFSYLDWIKNVTNIE
ncbi:brachyurin, partial [Asbolus verrucosus]